jgi:hypothetical protein
MGTCSLHHVPSLFLVLYASCSGYSIIICSSVVVLILVCFWVVLVVGRKYRAVCISYGFFFTLLEWVVGIICGCVEIGIFLVVF